MARPPATKGKTKTFIVKEGFIIGDFSDPPVRRHGGDQIELSKEQAQYYQKLGAITFDMGAVFDDNSTDTEAETGSEPSSDGEGDEDAGGTSGSAAPTPRKNKPKL